MNAEKNILFNAFEGGAEFSEDRRYRYALWRVWDKSLPFVMFIGLNPSTANEYDNDPTIKSVCRIARNNGFGGVYMMNCFPIVSTDPSILKDFENSDAPEDLENMRWLIEVSEKCSQVVFAWGNFKEVERRGQSLMGYFKSAKALAVNKNGSPKHPLYCKSNSKLVPFMLNSDKNGAVSDTTEAEKSGEAGNIKNSGNQTKT